MSTSGGTGGFLKPAAGRIYLLGGQGNVGGAAPTAGSLRLAPFFFPFAVPFTALGVNVTAAGDAASTLTPVFYTLDANGNPNVPVITGPALSGAAIAQVNGAQAGVIPAGHLWAGALCLSPGAVPTVTCVLRSDQDPRGSMVPVDGAAGTSPLPFQTGLGAVPNPFAGTYIGGTAPALFITT